MRGYLPSAFGLMFLVDSTKLKSGGGIYRPTGNGYHDYSIIEDAYASIRGRMPDLHPSALDILRNSRRAKNFIPVGYTGGQLLSAISPEQLSRMSAREWANRMGYQHEVPEEFEWFYVEDIEVYRDDADAVEKAPSATVSARNYLTAPHTGQTVLQSNGRGAGISYGRNELGRPFKDRVPITNPSGSHNDNNYPKNRYRNLWITHTVPHSHYIFGIADTLFGGSSGWEFGTEYGHYNVYPDRDVKGNNGDIYNGNEPIIFSATDGVRGGEYYHFLNYNNEHSTAGSGDSWATWIPGAGPSARDFGRTINNTYHLPIENTQLGIYRYAYPDMNSPTPFNLKLEHDARSKSYDDALMASNIAQKMLPLIMQLMTLSILGTITPILPIFALTNKGFLYTQIIGGTIEELLLGNFISTLPLRHSFSKGHKIAEYQGGNVITDNYTVWTFTLPQTETIQTEDEKFIKNRENPFVKIPVNKLFKSVSEFYDWLNKEGMLGNVAQGFFTLSGQRAPNIKVNMEPWMKSDYDVVWDKWTKGFHIAMSYNIQGYDRRPNNDTGLLYK